MNFIFLFLFLIVFVLGIFFGVALTEIRHKEMMDYIMEFIKIVEESYSEYRRDKERKLVLIRIVLKD